MPTLPAALSAPSLRCLSCGRAEVLKLAVFSLGQRLPLTPGPLTSWSPLGAHFLSLLEVLGPLVAGLLRLENCSSTLETRSES